MQRGQIQHRGQLHELTAIKDFVETPRAKVISKLEYCCISGILYTAPRVFGYLLTNRKESRVA